MTDEKDVDGNLLPDAQRLTKVGRFVRAASIDELPQLINVLKGDMALIGPRPLLVKYIPYYSERELLRHTVRPGITGWAQIHGRNRVLWEDRFELDVYYVEHLSLMMDIRIFFHTVKNILQHKDIEVAPNLMDFDEYRRQQAVGQVFLKVEDVIIDNQQIKVVRDDCYPNMGGGTKARKLAGYERYLRENGINAVVTCGGVHSNHNRAVALMALANNWKCHIVYHGNEKEFSKGLGNAGWVQMSGASIEFVTVDGISSAMDSAMVRFRNEGLKPYYIHGGGHDIPGATCFIEAVAELKRQCEEVGWKPDYIFHASGTGGTQAGLAVGLNLAGWSDVKLVGISVARQQEIGKKVIVDFAKDLSRYYSVEKDYSERIEFITDYIGVGYDLRSTEIKKYLKSVYRQTGLLLDEIYSGKAMYGMMKEIAKRHLQGKNILFWMTGGPLNAIS